MNWGFRLLLGTTAAFAAAAAASAQEIDGVNMDNSSYITGSGGDLILAFYAPNSSDLIFDLGSAASFENAGVEGDIPVTEFSGGGDSGIASGAGLTDFLHNFGANNNAVNWTIAGGSTSSHVLWLTSPSATEMQYTGTAAQQLKVIDYVGFAASETRHNNFGAANPGDALLVSHPIYNGIDVPAQTWVAGEQKISQAAAGVTELTLWELDPTSSASQPGRDLGFFVLNMNTGTLSFTPHFSAIPEPPVTALVAAGSALIAVFSKRRRRRA